MYSVMISLLLAAVGIGCVEGVVLPAPTPVITPAPRAVGVLDMAKRQDLDAISLAGILLTAVPESLREIAATNIPAVSTILWEQFLDGNKPSWFYDLPDDVQSYLVSKFGPSSTSDPDSTASGLSSDASLTDSAQSSNGKITSRRSGSSATTAVAKSTSSHSGSSSKATASRSPTLPTFIAQATSSPEHASGLSQMEKIGLGIGVPLALLAVVALALCCCLLLRRQRRRRRNRVSDRPSSPGFIPRFAFQEKSAANADHYDRMGSKAGLAHHELHDPQWNDDSIDAMGARTRRSDIPPPPVMRHGKPVMAPALFHTHSSNNARGTRTSYSSLHSVAEVSEPTEPVPNMSQHHTVPRVPIIPAIASLKRKPVPFGGHDRDNSPAARAASQTLLRETVPHDHNSSSSDLRSNSSHPSTSGALRDNTKSTSPVSLVSHDDGHRNPFSNEYAYEEDYGPEYHRGYVDVDDGLYGGNTSLSRYPEPRRSSRTEWPLKNFVTSGPRRSRSPQWDVVYGE